MPSNHGPQPVFPSPAPSGLYTPHLPSANRKVNGTWDLYIVDTANNNRGVVAAGWSLHYPSTVNVPWEHTGVGVPGSGTSGPAQVYPIEFDLTGVSPSSRVDFVNVTLVFQHSRPDDSEWCCSRPRAHPSC